MPDSADRQGDMRPPLDPAHLVALSLEQKFALVDDYWHPRIIAELNDSYVKIAKLNGEFVWHSHDDGDELFLVVRGTLTMRMRVRAGEASEAAGTLHSDAAGRYVEHTIGEGEMIVVPRGVEHMPVAEDEVHVVLIEPRTMLNTGDVRNDRTVDELEWV